MNVRLFMLGIVVICATITVVGMSPAAAVAQDANSALQSQPDSFAPIRGLAGQWSGEGNGESGTSTVERSYEFVLGGRYLQALNKSKYAPQDKNPHGEQHEDWGMFSYDKARKKLILRQFHVEGFVNQYVLDQVSADGKELSFVSESIENIPAGFRAREKYRLIDADTLEETFEIAEPGQDFAVYVVNKLKRVK